MAMKIFRFKFYFNFLAVFFLVSFNDLSAHNAFEKGFSKEQVQEATLSKQVFTALMRVEVQATQADIDRQYRELGEFLAHLQHKQSKYRSEKRFLAYFFYRVHRKFLKQYRPHTTLYELLEKGNYDCVTGSALYAILLDALGISYQVNEFPYHVYLTVAASPNDTFLLESTDPQSGWVTNQAEQQRRFAFYSQAAKEKNQAYFQYDFPIRGKINLTQLAGLSYFNEAVANYNQRKIQQAIVLLRQAEQFYASRRIESFKSLISSVAQNN